MLDDLPPWLQTNRRRVPKVSLKAKAIEYTLNQWDRLIGYCEDGRLHISNALAENAIRPFAVGRRNWLFADTPRGAIATVCSLIETAKADGLEALPICSTCSATSAWPIPSRRSRRCCLGTCLSRNRSSPEGCRFMGGYMFSKHRCFKLA